MTPLLFIPILFFLLAPSSYHPEPSRMVVMEKKRQLPSAPQLAKIAALLVLFLLAPFMPSLLRQPYLYLLFNTLVITLGVEAGFLAAISGSRDDKKPPSRSASPNLQVKQPSASHAAGINARLVRSTAGPTTNTTTSTQTNSPNKLLADAVLAKDFAAGADTASTIKKKKKVIKKCASRASIFFIGSVDGEDVDVTVHEEEEEHGKKGTGGEQMSKQELFTKVEAFIGNFYKQLKMQREESWKKLQDLYYQSTTTTTRPRPCS